MPPSASSAVVVLVASASWTWVLSRWSGRPTTTATTISAGARSSTRSSRVGLASSRMTTAPTRPSSDESIDVSVWVSIVRTWVTSLERREMSSPTRRPAWNSSDRVTSRAYSCERSRATMRSPMTPSR